METRTLVRAVVVAALVATLFAAAFHLTVSERFVDRTIRLEEQAEAEHLEAEGAAPEHHEPVFSRRTQKAGLLVGLVVYGLGAGAVFAGVYALLGQHLPGRSQRARVYLFGGITVFSAVLIPFLKYPSNPPGVGDPGTLTQRQLLYIGCLLLSVAGVWIAARVWMRLKARTTPIVAAVGAAAVLAV
jgi:MFS family permease